MCLAQYLKRSPGQNTKFLHMWHSFWCSLGLCRHGRGNPFATPHAPENTHSTRQWWRSHVGWNVISRNFVLLYGSHGRSVCLVRSSSLERAGRDVSSCVEICVGANGHRIHIDTGDQYIDIKCKEPHKTVTRFLSYLINLLTPSGYVTHHEVYHKFYVLPAQYIYFIFIYLFF